MGQPVWLNSLAPTSTLGLILETRDQVPHRAPCMEPASPSACVSASVCVCVCVCVSKIKKIKKKKENLVFR